MDIRHIPSAFRRAAIQWENAPLDSIRVVSHDTDSFVAAMLCTTPISPQSNLAAERSMREAITKAQTP